MLAASWEGYATQLANAEDGDFAAEVAKIVEEENIDFETAGVVFLGMDTRPSSQRLMDAALAGVAAASGVGMNLGLLSTPQLHFIVQKHNKGEETVANEAGYATQTDQAFRQLISTAPEGVDVSKEARGTLYLDAACGVGSVAVHNTLLALEDVLEVELRNPADNLPGQEAPAVSSLNEGCGAEHCQKGRLPPVNFEGESLALKRCCAFDGDADRVVFFTFDAEGNFRLLDGDKIATLCALFINEQLATLDLLPAAGGDVAVGAVQTAYANGASTRFIRETCGVEAPWVKTGVKFLHHKALEFDIGIYFEANGHGTIVFKEALVERLQKMAVEMGLPPSGSLEGAENKDDPRAIALCRLLAASRLINQAVGDAISDALFVEGVLAVKGWSVQEWDAIYEDLPSRQLKLAVVDRAVVVTNASETKVLEPEALQLAIDALVDPVECGRAFVRPSGTENVVRVYAEASTQEAADALATAVAAAAYEHAGGVGDLPVVGGGGH